MEELKFNSLDIRQIGKEEVNSVKLRELYTDLGHSEANFTTWCKKNLLQDFVENQDYVLLFLEKKLNRTETKRGGNNKAKDYIVTLDTAKHLALMSKTEKGKEIRQYFINVEKIAKDVLGEKRLELELKKLEIDMENYQVKSTLKQVKMLQDFGINYDPISLVNSESLKSKLPQHIGDALSVGASDIRPNAPIKSCTVLLKEFNVEILTKDFNEKLVEMGVLEEYFFRGKRFRKLSDDYRWYGRNLKFSSIRELPYDLKYYVDRFSQLIALVRNEGYID